MSTPSDIPAAEVFAIIEEPTAQTGRIRTFFLKVMAPFGGQMIPRGTHPAVVETATGKRVKGSATAATILIEDMQSDLETMSAGDFRARYLDV